MEIHCAGMGGTRQSVRQGAPRRSWPLGDRKGQSLALMAVAAVPLLGMMALAVDVGLLLTARDEAQRAADSGALAGAGVFLTINPADQPSLASSEASAAAIDYATRNVIRNITIEADEVTPEVDLDQQRVRVTVRREAVPTYFARILGFDEVPIAAVAAAEVSVGTSTIGGPGQCVLPMAMPDLWKDVVGDKNKNNVPDPGETWEFNPSEGDNYYPYETDPPPLYGASNGYPAGFDGTGYGSGFRSDLANDFGRRIWVKVGPPGTTGKGSGGNPGNMQEMVGPGNFQFWQMPDPAKGCQESTAGASFLKENITGCNPCSISINPESGGYPVDTQTGNIGGIAQELGEVNDSDPDAYWDDTCSCIKGSKWGSHDAAVANSGRVKIVALYSPDQILQGSSKLQLNNFAKVFLETGGMKPPDFPVYARFLGPVSGNGGDEEGTTGSLIKYLRLVE